VSVRDRASRELLVSLGLSPERILLSGDASFHLAAPPAPGGGEEDRIGVSLRHWPLGPSPETWEPPVAEALDRVLEQRPGARVVFVPLQAGGREIEDDPAVAARVRDRLRHRDRADILGPRDLPHGARGALARCRVVLAMRLHALLFAMAAGRPVVGLSYDPKIEAALRDAGLEESVVRLEDLPSRDLASLLEKARAADPAHVDGLRRGVRGSAQAAVAAMESGVRARLTPTLGAVVIEAWMKQLQEGPPDQRDAMRRLEALQERWEVLVTQVQDLRSRLRGPLSDARPGR
jgi:polysaccharide pyruvyl transferase WcaK-like protein